MRGFKIEIDRSFRMILQRLLIARRRGDPAIIRDGKITLPDDVDPFAKYQIGQPFGSYDEKIVRIERRLSEDLIPDWFEPQEKPYHVAMRSYGRVIYMETELNAARRAKEHPFDVTLVTFNTPDPEVLSLFDYGASRSAKKTPIGAY